MKISDIYLNMSTILSYSSNITSISSPDATITLQAPLRFEKVRKQAIRLIKASFSSQIPNVYSIGTFNNGLFALSRDGGVNWTNIQLDDGVYSIANIQSALNATVATWWTDDNDPGITIQYNTATFMVYIDLDSTKLVAPGTQLGIDLSLSDCSALLGYNDPANQTFITDALHTADSYAKMNWCGDSVSIILDGFGPVSVKNGALSNELCSIPLSTSSGVRNEYVYPSNAIISPVITLTRPISELRSYSISFKGSRVDSTTNQQIPLYILEGAVEVVIEMAWE